MKTLQTLKTCCLFSFLDDDQLARILPLCKSRIANDNAVLFTQGQRADYLYIVEQGKVVLELLIAPDRGLAPARPAQIALLGPGEAFGWSAIIEPHEMTLTARAAGPGSVLLIDGATLREMLQRHRAMGYAFMHALCRLLAERLMQTRTTLIYERGWAVGV